MYLLWQISLLWAFESETFGLNSIQIPSSTKLLSPVLAGWLMLAAKEML